MKVLVLFSSGEIGGAENSIIRMVSNSTGVIQYTVGTVGGEGRLLDLCRARRLRILRPNNSKKKNRIATPWIIINIIRNINKEKYDIIYSLGIRSSLLVRSIKFLINGTKVVQGVRWDPSEKTLKNAFFIASEFFLKSITAGYICNSKVASFILTKYAIVPVGNVEVIYNGYDVNWSGVEDRAVKYEVVVVANLKAGKGYFEFVEYVVKKVVEIHSAARFAFVGRDDSNGEIQKFVNDQNLASHISFLGFIQDVPSVLRASKIFVLPSKSEACPTAILEAMGEGLPVVAFSVGGIPELVAQMTTGILVDPFKYSDMVDAILKLIEDPVMAYKFGQAGCERVLGEFTTKNCARKHNTAFLRF